MATVSHSYTCMTKRLLSGDPRCAACGESDFIRVDRVSGTGDLREHLARRADEGRTIRKALCGVDLPGPASAAGNRECLRCLDAAKWIEGDSQ